jgi:hypothetical protein
MSVGVILWFVTCIATFPFVTSSGYIASGMKLLSAVLPNTAIIWGYRLILAYESKSKYFAYYVLTSYIQLYLQIINPPIIWFSNDGTVCWIDWLIDYMWFQGLTALMHLGLY